MLLPPPSFSSPAANAVTGTSVRTIQSTSRTLNGFLFGLLGLFIMISPFSCAYYNSVSFSSITDSCFLTIQILSSFSIHVAYSKKYHKITLTMIAMIETMHRNILLNRIPQNIICRCITSLIMKPIPVKIYKGSPPIHTKRGGRLPPFCKSRQKKAPALLF